MLRTLKLTTSFTTLGLLAGCSAILGISSDPHTESALANDAGGNNETETGTIVEPPDAGADADAGPATCQGTLYVRIASDFSGGATDIAIPHFWGLYDHLRELNSHGGILGCKVDFDVKDNNYTGPQTAAVVDGWRASDPHWKDVNTVFIFGTGPTTTAGPQIMAEKKVIVPGSYAGALAAPGPVDKSVPYGTVAADFTEGSGIPEAKKSAGWPYVFFPATDYGTAIRLGMQAAWQLAPGRIAFAHGPAADLSDALKSCAYCVDPLAAGKSFISSLPGMSIGRDLVFPQTSTDAATVTKQVTDFFTAEIDHFKTANASSYKYDPVTWVWSGNSVYATAILAKTIVDQQKIIDADDTIKGILSAAGKTWKIRVMANNWGIGETTPQLCGPACNSDVMYGLFPVRRFGDLSNSAAMSELLAARDVWAMKDVTTPPPAPITARKFTDYRDVRYVQGYVAAIMWETAVVKAVQAGHASPTGEDIKNALEAFNLQDLGGLTAGPITFTTADHRPQSNEAIYKLDNAGNLVIVDTYAINLTTEWLGY